MQQRCAVLLGIGSRLLLQYMPKPAACGVAQHDSTAHSKNATSSRMGWSMARQHADSPAMQRMSRRPSRRRPPARVSSSPLRREQAQVSQQSSVAACTQEMWRQPQILARAHVSLRCCWMEHLVTSGGRHSSTGRRHSGGGRDAAMRCRACLQLGRRFCRQEMVLLGALSSRRFAALWQRDGLQQQGETSVPACRKGGGGSWRSAKKGVGRGRTCRRQHPCPPPQATITTYNNQLLT